MPANVKPLPVYCFDVYLNVTQDPHGRLVAMITGFQPGNEIVRVASVTVQAKDVTSACERVFHLLNVGEDPTFGEPDQQAIAYRARRNRSLSVGDVLIADGAAMAVADFGFQPVQVEPSQVVVRTEHGVTPFP